MVSLHDSRAWSMVKQMNDDWSGHRCTWHWFFSSFSIQESPWFPYTRRMFHFMSFSFVWLRFSRGETDVSVNGASWNLGPCFEWIAIIIIIVPSQKVATYLRHRRACWPSTWNPMMSTPAAGDRSTIITELIPWILFFRESHRFRISHGSSKVTGTRVGVLAN